MEAVVGSGCVVLVPEVQASGNWRRLLLRTTKDVSDARRYIRDVLEEFLQGNPKDEDILFYFISALGDALTNAWSHCAWHKCGYDEEASTATVMATDKLFVVEIVNKCYIENEIIDCPKEELDEHHRGRWLMHEMVLEVAKIDDIEYEVGLQEQYPGLHQLGNAEVKFWLMVK